MYEDLWLEILSEFYDQLDPQEDFEFEKNISQIKKIGNRKSYNGYLEYWSGHPRSFTNSAVFRDLNKEIDQFSKLKKNVFGWAEFRIKSDSLTISYEPLNYPNILWWYQNRVIPEGKFEEEKYKWELIKSFQDLWKKYESKEVSFVQFYQSIDFSDLVWPISRGVIDHVAREAPDKLEELFWELFDESKDLKSRIVNYQNNFEKAYFGIADHGKNTFQEERTIATLLTFRYPEKYTFYKDSFYTILSKGLGIKPKPAGQKLLHYYELVNEFLPEIKRDKELIQWINEHLDEDCYSDENHLILAQDILYTSLDQVDNPEQIEESSLNYILVNITWNSNDWKGVSEDKSNHAWVKEGGIPHESWNFDFDSPRNADGNIKGYAKFTNPPSVEGDNNLIIFYSGGKIVGFYANAEFFKEPVYINENEDYNFQAPKELVCVLENKIDNPKEKGFLEGLSRVGQVGFSYLKKEETIIDILNEARDTNPNQSTTIDRILEWVDEKNPAFSNENMNDMEELNTVELNKILFGPPGTGKTFNTINEAIKIVNPEFYEQHKHDRDKLKDEYKRLLIRDWDKDKTGRIAFCTFHQSYSYEDFVEGIKPLTTDEKEVYYDIEDGVFKLLCQRAKDEEKSKALKEVNLVNMSEDEFQEAFFYKISLGDSTKSEDQEIYDYCIENNVIAIGFGDQNDFTNLSEIEVSKKLKELDYPASHAQLLNYFIHYLTVGNYVVVGRGNKHVRAVGRVTGEYKYEKESPITFNHFREVEWVFTNEDIPIDELYDRSLQMQTIYKLDKNGIKRSFFVPERGAKKVDSLGEESGGIGSDSKYVLIIDEINRGNVSSIFGELITLLEKDKRKGGDEELELILPYSKAVFSVPSNVYVIGTMNTADRSVESLDTALRRRFTFEEKPSKPAVIKEHGKSQGKIGKVDLVALLATINARIEKLIDKDHCIGHAYFMNAESMEDLRVVFENKVIPLLEEYFFGDFGKIGLVLGEAFVQMKQTAEDFKFANFESYDPGAKDDLKQRPVYQIGVPSDEDGFTSIYESTDE